MEVNLPQSLPSIEASTQLANGSGTTQLIKSMFRYTWTISDYSLREEKNAVLLVSPIFLAGTKNKNRWCLEAYPNGESKDHEGYLSLFLKLLTNDETTEVKAKFSISITESETRKKSAHHVFKKQDSNWGWYKFVERTTLLDATNHILSEDSLTVVCDMTIIEGSVTIAIPSDSEELKVPKCRLLDDLSDLFESLKLSDVTLITSSREFKAHKVILATRSPVFSAMFQSEMLEQQQNRVNIGDDVNDDVLMEMLRFIYTGTTRNMDKMADGLLAAAEKYQLERLKRLCEKSLSESIAIENAASRLVLGDLYGAVFLKAKAVDFICTHTKEVIVTAAYKSLHNTHPHLIDEVFCKSTTRRILPVTVLLRSNEANAPRK